MSLRGELSVPSRSYNHPCLIAQALDILGDRWTMIILRDLMSGLQHFNDILANSQGLSPNILSSRLKRLEAEGLIERQEFRELPPRVEYHLTEKGWATRPILVSLIHWSATYLNGITSETVGNGISTDFAVRVLPAFAFNPDRAEGLHSTMRIEISDCDECESWTFIVRDGRLLPFRELNTGTDAVLRTSTEGFFRFVQRGAMPEECGELQGDREAAVAIQACFDPI